MGCRVFVYGTLKRGFPNHRVLSGARFIGADVVEGWLHDLGYYPGMVDTPGLLVHGEVFEVGEDGMARLDRLEGIGKNDGTGLYDRRRVVSAETGLPMWTYIATQPTIARSSQGVIESGVWSQPAAEVEDDEDEEEESWETSFST